MSLVPALASGISATSAQPRVGRGIRWNAVIPMIAAVVASTMVPGAIARRTSAPNAAPTQLVRVVVRAVRGADKVPAMIHAAGGVVERSIGIINGYTATVPAAAVATLRASSGVLSVSDDAPLHLLGSSYAPDKDPYSLFDSQKDLGVRDLWGHRVTGDGVDVALIDSGVAPVAGLGDPGQVIYGPDLSEESQNPATENLDTYGHGTFMAGIIAGHDSGIDPVGRHDSPAGFMGYAPDARIVSVKVADAHGATDVSQVLAGIDWVVQHANDPGMHIRVINLSFGTDSAQPYTIDPLAFAAEAAWRAGIVVVTSAGNAGGASAGLTDPAIDPFVLAVGADDMNGTGGPADDSIAAFSSNGDGVRNPDVVMPGVHMQSLRVPGSYIDSQYSSTGAINDRFFRGSGTSEAAAVASGTVALLLDKYPTATPDQVKALLTSTAVKIPKTSAQAQGNGLGVAGKAAAAKPLPVVQAFTPSTGTGSLDASRGSARLELNGVVLDGERDIMGNPVNTATLAALEATGTAWQGGVWNGVRWSGDDWAGVRWSGARWSGSDWTGVRWSGVRWSNGTWDGVRWSDTTWASSVWDGVRWSGARWSGDVWCSGDWS